MHFMAPYVLFALIAIIYCQVGAQDLAPNSPDVDYGPCKTLTTNPGFIAANNRSKPIYLDVLGGNTSFPRSFSERYALYSTSRIHNCFWPGCANFDDGCLSLFVQPTKELIELLDWDINVADFSEFIPFQPEFMMPGLVEPLLAAWNVQTNCTYEDYQRYKVLDDGSITPLSSPDTCIGLANNDTSIIVGPCASLQASDRFYWIEWD